MERSYSPPIGFAMDFGKMRRWLRLQTIFFILKHFLGIRNPVLLWNCSVELFRPFGDNLEDAVIAFHRTLHEEELKHRPR